VTRRGLLGAAVATALLGGVRSAAGADEAVAGALRLTPPPGTVPDAGSPWGSRWQYAGVQGDPTRPDVVVLARGDLRLGDPWEGLASVLSAPAGGGALPGFRLGAVVAQRVPGAAAAVRAEVGYDASWGAAVRGAVLSALGGPGAPSGIVLAVGGPALTAAVLDTLFRSVHLAGTA
jgi:hypothetical protein